MTLGEKILNMRKARGWNQEELAEHIGVTRQAVSRWESNSAKPDADKIVAICELFGVSADYLLREKYAGDGISIGNAEISQMKQKISALSAKHILGFGMLAVGLTTLIALEIVCVIYPHTLHTDTKIYQGLAAYVRVYDIQWIVWVLWMMVGTGIVMIAWDRLTGLWRKLQRRFREKVH